MTDSNYLFQLAEPTSSSKNRPKSAPFDNFDVNAPVNSFRVILRRSPSGFGFKLSLDGSHQITHIESGSPVSSKDVRIGDRLIRVNGTRTDSMPYRDIQKLLSEVKGDSELRFIRASASESEGPTIAHPSRSKTLNPKIQNSNNIQWHQDALEAEGR